MTREIIVEELKKIVISKLRNDNLNQSHLVSELVELDKCKNIEAVIGFAKLLFFGEDANRKVLAWLIRAINNAHNESIDDLK